MYQFLNPEDPFENPWGDDLEPGSDEQLAEILAHDDEALPRELFGKRAVDLLEVTGLARRKLRKLIRALEPIGAGPLEK